MRRDHYHIPSSVTPEEGHPDWRPTPAPGPYGSLPGEKTRQTQTPSPRTPDFRRPRPSRARMKRGALRGFALSLCLILLLSGAGLCYRLSLGDRLSDFTLPWGALIPELPVWWDWPQELPYTSVPPAAPERRSLPLAASTGESLTPQEIYQQVSPAIVGIRAYTQEGTSLGTGVVMSSDGYIITNAHVIAGGTRLEILFSDGQRLEALLAGYDAGTDLAVLKTQPEAPLTPAQFGSSDSLTVGESAYAIGNPLGEELRGTMTDGIISAIDRDLSTQQGTMTLIQTTAALNPGNSGGALVNAGGQVVGITNMKMASPLQPIEALGFAIPTALVKPVVEQLMALGEYLGQPMLGIRVQNAYDASLPTPAPMGALIVEVEEDTDAFAQGLLPGDVIVRAGGRAVTSTEELSAAKEGLLPGDLMMLQLLRGDKLRWAAVTLGPKGDAE